MKILGIIFVFAILEYFILKVFKKTTGYRNHFSDIIHW